MSYQPMHTARVHKGSWFIRLFLFMWPIRPEDVDFCKLFWGYVFAPLNLLVRFVTLPVALLWRFVLAPRMREKERQRREMTDEEWVALRKTQRAKEKARKDRINAFFGRISGFADRFIVAPCKAVAATRGWTWFLRALMVVSGVALAGVIVWGLIVIATHHALVYLFAAAFLAGTLAVVGVVLTGIFFVEETPTGQAVAFHTKKGAVGFVGAIRTGFWGVKNRTCPQIELVSKETVHDTEG
jgi:ABC-type multidrug transport system fused ATPase/permease subunit